MKRNAAIGEEYQKNAAELNKNNLYNPEMAAWENDFDNFSTVGDNGQLNSWLSRSPSAYRNIDELLSPVVSKVQPIYDPQLSAKDPGRIHKTVTLDRLMSAFNDDMADILATPSGRFLLHQSQQEADKINTLNPNLKLSALDVLKAKASNRLQDFVRDDITDDHIYLKNLEHKNRISEINYNHSLNSPKPEKNPLQFSERIQMEIEDKYNQSVKDKILKFAKDSLKQAEMREANPYRYKNVNGKQVRYKVEYKTKYDSKFWKDAIKDIDKNGEAVYKKYGFVDDKGNISKTLQKYSLKEDFSRNNGKEYWNNRSYTPASDYEKSVTRNLFAGSDRTVDIMKEKYNTISLSDSGVNYAPYRYASLADSKNPKVTNLQHTFQSWLQSSGILGYVDNSPVDIAIIPNGNRPNDTDLRGNVLIKAEDLQKFFDKVKGNSAISSSENENKIAKDLRLKKRTYHLKESSTNGGPTESVYYVVPIIRSTGITMDDIN
ncbi:hypothetical protein [Sharpea azabuensis]|uniref:hypothetical protein n=1 Tax=Sharpea azabuensis TaxID=322505 RepID=UPI00156934DB|nr:hypothetical protein [Sharpea azabuensis]